MKLDYETLEKISSFIDSEGFKAIEKIFEQKKKNNDTLRTITSDIFQNGVRVGIVDGIKMCCMEFELIKKEIKQMEEEKKHGTENTINSP